MSRTASFLFLTSLAATCLGIGASEPALGTPTCVTESGQEACASETYNPISGATIWTLSNEEFEQKLQWHNGILKNTSVLHFTNPQHTTQVDWSDNGTREYELHFAFENETPELLIGPTNADGFL